MTTQADASLMSASRAEKPGRPIKDPSLASNFHIKRTEKLPGSLVLSLGKWWVVQADGKTLVEKID